MTAAGDAGPGAVDPAALAARISANLKAGLEQDPHVVACSPDLIRVLTAYLDSAAPMIAAALDRDRLAADLAAARDEVAQARDAALEEAARIADRHWDGMVVLEARGASEVAALIRAAALTQTEHDHHG